MPIVDPIPYRPWLDRGHVVEGTFRWRLGARPLDLHDWIELGDDATAADGWIAQKPRIMADHARTVFATMDDVVPECEEVAQALVAHLRTRFPDRYGDVGLDTGLHPLDAAARLVPEDLVVMAERDGRLVFGAGSVCFPNRWDLISKIGAPMAQVHAPVAQLNEQLEQAVDGFFDRLRPQRSFWRLGWGVLDTADGYTPTDGTAAPRPQHPTIDDLHVRVERETLRRFPLTNAVLFTIRTYVSPLRSVIADPANRDGIATIVDAMPADVRGYKAITDAMRRAVDGRAAGSRAAT